MLHDTNITKLQIDMFSDNIPSMEQLFGDEFHVTPRWNLTLFGIAMCELARALYQKPEQIHPNWENISSECKIIASLICEIDTYLLKLMASSCYYEKRLDHLFVPYQDQPPVIKNIRCESFTIARNTKFIDALISHPRSKNIDNDVHHNAITNAIHCLQRLRCQFRMVYCVIAITLRLTKIIHDSKIDTCDPLDICPLCECDGNTLTMDETLRMVILQHEMQSEPWALILNTQRIKLDEILIRHLSASVPIDHAIVTEESDEEQESDTISDYTDDSIDDDLSVEIQNGGQCDDKYAYTIAVSRVGIVAAAILYMYFRGSIRKN